MAKGEYSDDAQIPFHIKRKKIIKRIHEWEKFEANCQLLRELDNEKVLKISELQKQRRKSLDNAVTKRKTKQSNLMKAKSYPNQLSPV